MGKNSKKKKKEKPVNYKLFSTIGVFFHLIMYLLYDITFYNDTLLWLSIILCGLISGIYFIKKMELINPKSYKNKLGNKLNLYMFTICFFMIIGTTTLFGNVINGTIIGLNYIVKTNEINNYEFQINTIEHNRTGGKRRFRRNNPKVFFEKDGDLTSINLTERYNSKINYSEFKTIEMNLCKGMFGFEIIDAYDLKK